MRPLRHLANFLALACLLPPAGVGAATFDTLTVVTLNLWHDQQDWPGRLKVILAELRRIRPDVLCLQEVLQNPSLRNQAETLGDSLGCHVRFASVDGPERPKRYGNAVLTPHRVLAGGGRNLDPADDYRAVAHQRFAWRGHAIDAYSTHLHHTAEGGAIRARQIRHLLAWVDSSRGGGPTVIAGDFNCEPGSPELNLVTARHLDAFRAVHPKASRREAATYSTRFGIDPGAIDHIFVEQKARSRLEPIACEVIFREPGPDSVWASDHFGVVAKFRVRRSDRSGITPGGNARGRETGMMRGEFEELPVPGGPARMYVTGRGNFAPSVVVFHPWWGLNPDVIAFADRLADAGFTVAAPDLVRGRQAATVEEAERLASSVDEAHADAVALAAIDRLAGTHGSARIGAVGFSMGVPWAMWCAARRPAVAASVVYYGTLTGASLTAASAPVLGHFAESDEFEPEESVRAFESTLRDAGRTVAMHRYPGTGHWFAEPSRDAWRREAADLAFERTVAFLKEHLKGAGQP